MTQGFLPFNQALKAASPTRHKTHIVEWEKFAPVQDARQNELALGIIQACQIKLSHLYDKLGCLSNSRTRLLPHQIEATHIVVNSLRPRFLLADEVGLGKTIEAGLIIKELMLRKGMSKVLIILPAPLAIQWQQEMASKFNEDFEILSRKNFYQFASRWSQHKKVITSIDFIKNPVYSEDILRANWEIVIFDEAHRLRRDYSSATRAWSFAEKMAKKCDALLLLSATPFRGKLEELFYLLHLIDPHLLGPYHNFVQDYVMPQNDPIPDSNRLAQLKDKISKVMLRRRKVDVGGFTKRHACTIQLELSPPERLLYDETTEYVKREYNLAQKEKNRAVSFIMIVFQKLLDSSSRALLRALERRKTNLENKMYNQAGAYTEFDGAMEDGDLEDYLDEMETPEEYLDQFEQDQISTLKDIRKELLSLNYLIKLARDVKQDRKVLRLIETINRLKKEGNQKFIIFTQFRTTQDYLAQELGAQYCVTVFHGSLNWKEKEEAIETFRTTSQILILTEAGGEGRNLQFTNILFNYDLPWSPLKIEQRIGRIHRFGQAKDVYIFNFATAGTVAQRILEVLETKIHLFSETIGTPDILLGSLEDENRFQKNLMKFVTGHKSRQELEEEIEAKSRIAKTGYARLNDLLTPHCVDFNLNDYYDYTNKNRRIDNDRIEKLTNEYLGLNSDAGYKLVQNDKNLNAPKFSKEFESPYLLKKAGQEVYSAASFISEQALANPSWEFLALGHGLVEDALNFFLTHPTRHFIRYVDGFKGLENGRVFAFLCEFQNGMKRTEILYCYVDMRGHTKVYEDEHLHRGRWIQAPQNDDRCKDKIILQTAIDAVEKHSLQMALDLKESLHSIFKTEEYKLEISYGKKLRFLHEKLDRMKFRYQQNPIKTNQALMTRTENQINATRFELESALIRIRQESGVVPQLTLLQVIKSCV